MSDETKAIKKPQDRKSKKLTPDENGLFWVKVGGHKYSIDPALLNDFELLADLHEVDGGGPGAAVAMTGVLKRFLGADQYRDAMNRLRVDGVVTVEAGSGFVAELLGALNPNS